MIAIEEAQSITSNEATRVQIDWIYDSIGSCNECESLDFEVGAMLGECVRYGCLKIPTGYCDEFIRRQDGA